MNDRSRGVSPAPEVMAATDTKSTGLDDNHVAAQLRRRRAASQRMPVLPFDERRDPIDPPRGDRRHAVTCTLVRHSAVFTGPTGAIRTAINIAGARSMSVLTDRNAIATPIDHADDVISQLRYGQNRIVYLIDEAP